MTMQHNQNAPKHKAYTAFDSPTVVLDDPIAVLDGPTVVLDGPTVVLDGIIKDLFAKYKILSEYIDTLLQEDNLDIKAFLRVFPTYGRMATCLGKLLRDKQTLSGKPSPALNDAINQALDELSAKFGTEL